MTGHQIVQWILAGIAVAVLSFVIGRLSVHDKYVEAVRGCEIIARYDRAATVWLRAQSRAGAARKPDAEAHIEHLKAVAAMLVASIPMWLTLPSLRDLTDGEARERKTRAVPQPTRLTWPGTFADLLPANARERDWWLR